MNNLQNFNTILKFLNNNNNNNCICKKTETKCLKCIYKIDYKKREASDTLTSPKDVWRKLRFKKSS